MGLATAAAASLLLLAGVASAGSSILNAPVPNRPDGGFFTGSFTGFSSVDQGNTLGHSVYSSLFSLDIDTNTLENFLMDTDEEIILAAVQNPTDGHIFIAGTFEYIDDVYFGYIAEWDGTEFSPLGPGLDYYVTSLAHNGTHLFVGGCFDGPNYDSAFFSPYSGGYMNDIAVWSNGQWGAIQGGGGLAGCVEALYLNGSTLYVTGEFQGTDDLSILPGDAILSVTASATAAALTTAPGNFSASFLLTNNASNPIDEPGHIWTLPKFALENGLDSSVIIDLGADVYIAKIRIANTNYNGGGTSQFIISGTPNDPPYTAPLGAYPPTAEYYDPVLRQMTSCANGAICNLYHDPSQPYIDFYIYTNFRAIAITIVSAYNYTAGLAAVQVFTDEIFFYPIPINPNATLTTTGTWQKGAEDNTIETTVTSANPSITLETPVYVVGAHEVVWSYYCAATATSCVTSLGLTISVNGEQINSTTVSLNPALVPDTYDQYGYQEFFSGSLPVLLQPGDIVTIVITPKGNGNSIGFFPFYLQKIATVSGNLNGFAVYNLSTNNAPTPFNVNWPFTSGVSLQPESIGSANLVIFGEFVLYIDSKGNIAASGTEAGFILQYNTVTGTFASYPGNGLNSYVYTVAPMNGGFVAGGDFGSTFNTTTFYEVTPFVTIFNTTTSSWISVGKGVNSVVDTLAVVGDTIYLGGAFDAVYQSYIVFDNSENHAGFTTYSLTDNKFYEVVEFWSEDGPQVTNIYAVPNSPGQILLGGYFSHASTTVGQSTAQKSNGGQQYNAVNGGFSIGLNQIVDGQNPQINTGVNYNGQFVVAGSFATQGSYYNYLSNIAYNNGSAWLSVDQGVSGEVYTSAIVGGNVWFGGSFVTNTFLYSNPNAAALNGLAAWNGSQLFNAAPLLSYIDGQVTVKKIVNAFGVTFVGGLFTYAGNSAANNIAAWDGTNWYGLGVGVNGQVNDMASTGSTLVVGGTFTLAGGLNSFYLATFDWNTQRWTAVGYNYLNNGITALAVDNANSIFVAGPDFSYDNEYYNIAYYNGEYFNYEVGLPSNTYSLSNVLSMEILSADNAAGSNYGFSSGKVLVIYGTIYLQSTDSQDGSAPPKAIGSAIYDGADWFAETEVVNNYDGAPALITGYVNGPSSSGLAAWAIAIAVVFSVVGAALIGGLVYFIYKKVASK